MMLVGFLQAGPGSTEGQPGVDPLKNRESVLMMHEITVGCTNVTKPIMFGLPKFDGRLFNRCAMSGARVGIPLETCCRLWQHTWCRSVLVIVTGWLCWGCTHRAESVK